MMNVIVRGRGGSDVEGKAEGGEKRLNGKSDVQGGFSMVFKWRVEGEYIHRSLIGLGGVEKDQALKRSSFI